MSWHQLARVKVDNESGSLALPTSKAAIWPHEFEMSGRINVDWMSEWPRVCCWAAVGNKAGSSAHH